MFAEFGRYTQSIQEAGAMVGGDPLQPPEMATTVRVEDGETITTDGPFAETKEWLGGDHKIDLQAAGGGPVRGAESPPGKDGGAIEGRAGPPVAARVRAAR